MILVFDLIYKNIKLLFMMMVLANYAVYFMFIILMHSEIIAVDEQRERRLLPFKIVAHSLYFFCFGVAIHPSFGKCNDNFIYRKFKNIHVSPYIALDFILLFSANLILAVFVVHFYR